MRTRTHLRPAFTLIELIVVIGIIALLATLSAAAVMRVQESQRESNTNKYLLKLSTALEQQRKATRDRISQETPHPLILAITAKDANGLMPDPARAKVLHMKLRMRQEFPQTYAEARFTWPSGGPFAALNGVYGPKPLYLAAIGNGTGTDPTMEAAVLLVAVLSQNRSGGSFAAEDGVPTNTFDYAGKTVKVFMDSWGEKPMCLRRWATDGEPDALTDLNTLPQVTQAMMTSNLRDSEDPDGRLVPENWDATGAAANRAIAETWFTQPLPTVVHPFGSFTDGTFPYGPFKQPNRGPYVMSAGKDRKYATPDDLLSFRLSSTGRGN
jgi:prepilin-type N-terminal cleavage/methylation domain-containing protein